MELRDIELYDSLLNRIGLMRGSIGIFWKILDAYFLITIFLKYFEQRVVQIASYIINKSSFSSS